MSSNLGLFGWHDMNTADLATSRDFYCSLFGWTLDAEPRSNGYRMLLDGDSAFGGMFEWPPEVSQPSRWTGYVLVDDVVEIARRAQSLGGGYPFESMSIPGAGTLGFVVDPTGAALTTFRPDIEMTSGAPGPGGSGATVLWNELLTTDLAASVAFHQELFGWAVDQSVVDAGGYVIARAHGRPVAGIFQPSTPPGSSDWITYFGVENIEETMKRAAEIGGRVVHQATDVPGVGTTAWLLDTNASIFGVMQPAEGWFARL